MEFVVSVGGKNIVVISARHTLQELDSSYGTCVRKLSQKSFCQSYIGDNMIKLNRERSFQHCLAAHAGIFYCSK